MLTHEEANTLAARTYALVRACPAGRVTTYGWLAKTLGYPRGARFVGWFMNKCPRDVPAQRVINSKGELSGSWAFGSSTLMRQLLENEGIEFLPDGRVDLKRYGWDPSRDLSQEQQQHIFAGAGAVEVSDGMLHLLLNDPASPFQVKQNG
jgi:methylated-DNA-protein-cysteine methyltransferase-like protein